MPKRTLTAALLAALPLSATAADHAVNVSGFIKFDALTSRYDSGVPSNDLQEHFFVPSLIPTGDGREQTRFNAHARESRFRMTTDSEVDGHAIGTHLELDFMVTDVPGSDERISNSNAPRIRHAFVTVDNWLFGQTWSTFYNVGSLPELNDFVGPVGTLFNRQAQMRYSVDTAYGTWHLAAENPETRVRDNATYDARTPTPDNPEDNDQVISDQHEAPDLAVRYDWASEAGSNVSLAFLGRQLSYQKQSGNLETTWGYGASLAGKLKVGARDDFRFMANYGHLGRYLGLNAFADGAVEADGDIAPSKLAGGLLAYRHFWAEGLRSTISVSAAQSDADQADVGGAAAEQYVSSHINLMVSPVAALTYGIEYSHAERENFDGDKGTMERVQFSAKYAF